ncbi:hypothetical protein R1sor_008658 [Riccia sorocarpa]|uniref:Uncharacterized protein n=1 Tax=Riccia sorocarpa TaxID=122646 RepID=A0ABD3HXL0_9MARC
MAMAAFIRLGSCKRGLQWNWAFDRGFAADHHGSSKVNIWEAPGSPSKWKEEHFVFASLGGWGTLFFAGYKAATGGTKKKENDSHHPPKPEKAKDGSKASPRKPETKPVAGKLKDTTSSPPLTPPKPDTKHEAKKTHQKNEKSGKKQETQRKPDQKKEEFQSKKLETPVKPPQKKEELESKRSDPSKKQPQKKEELESKRKQPPAKKLKEES